MSDKKNTHSDIDELSAVMKEKKLRKKLSRREIRKRQLRKKYMPMVITLSVILACFVGLFIYQYITYDAYEHMRTSVENARYYPGTLVEGVDVSGMTLAEAKDYWAKSIEPAYYERTITLSNGNSVTAKELGYESSYGKTLEKVWSDQRKGTLAERYGSLTALAEQPASYNVTRNFYKQDAVDKYLQALAAAENVECTSATLTGFDPEKYTFVFGGGTIGREVDVQTMSNDITSALDAGGGEVQLAIIETHPETTSEDISSQYGCISFCATSTSGSTDARRHNLKLAMSFLNGYCIQPGETFSFDAVVGERTAARGFKKAGAYSSGGVTSSFGGGVCQISSTLFNVAVCAGMEIVERHEHSMTVHYLKAGKDAAVDWGKKDLKFKNVSNEPVYIACMLDGDRKVRFGIFGRLFEKGQRIELDSETIRTTGYPTEYRVNRSLPTGAVKKIASGTRGCVMDTYRVFYVNDKEVKREFMFRSYYDPKTEVLEVGA